MYFFTMYFLHQKCELLRGGMWIIIVSSIWCLKHSSFSIDTFELINVKKVYVQILCTMQTHLDTVDLWRILMPFKEMNTFHYMGLVLE